MNKNMNENINENLTEDLNTTTDENTNDFEFKKIEFWAKITKMAEAI